MPKALLIKLFFVVEIRWTYLSICVTMSILDNREAFSEWKYHSLCRTDWHISDKQHFHTVPRILCQSWLFVVYRSQSMLVNSYCHSKCSVCYFVQYFVSKIVRITNFRSQYDLALLVIKTDWLEESAESRKVAHVIDLFVKV